MIGPNITVTGFVILSVLSLSLGRCSESDPQVRPPSYADLIAQLTAPRFAVREAATEALVRRGEAILPALRRSLADISDPEAQWRIDRAVQKILLAAGNGDSPKMIVIPAGAFIMGTNSKRKNDLAELPPHPVELHPDFLLGQQEVTQKQFQALMKFQPSEFTKIGKRKDIVPDRPTANFPVDSVTWFDALAFCNAFSKQSELLPYYQIADRKMSANHIVDAKITILGGNGYRLPTEAEWEYACRAGTLTRFHFGNRNGGREANIKSGVATGYGSAPTWKSLNRPTEVGSYPANQWGLQDMHGNIAEWCWDWYASDYYTQSPKANPSGPESGTHRVVRGGSYLVMENSCQSDSRMSLLPSDPQYYVGFRLARTPGPARSSPE